MARNVLLIFFLVIISSQLVAAAPHVAHKHYRSIDELVQSPDHTKVRACGPRLTALFVALQNDCSREATRMRSADE
ncbi:hypothetical protein PMAYCL1PPCAC_20650, partial [Pristionchus mayeri]